MMNYWTRQSISLFVRGGCSSSLKCRDYKDFTDVIQEESMEQNQRKYVLRRLTPTECARLQGFPDSFVIPVSDLQAYKQFGNSVVVPLMKNLAELVTDTLSTLDNRN
jgi:DNA (cytosine-5)-methyltransferase 1